MNPKLSIILPSYNGELWLPKCIDSILNQSFKDFELILINDGSDDSTLSIMKDYQSKDDRILVLTQDNSGVSTARDNGLNHMTGDWVTFVDHDDYLDPECYAKALAHAESSNVDLVQFGVMRFNEEKSWSRLEHKSEVIDITKTLLGENVFVWNKIYKSYLFNNLRFNDPIYKRYCKSPIGEDTLLIAKVYNKLESIYYLNDKLYFHRRLPDSLGEQMVHLGKQFKDDYTFNLELVLKNLDHKSKSYPRLKVWLTNKIKLNKS